MPFTCYQPQTGIRFAKHLNQSEETSVDWKKPLGIIYKICER